MHELFLEGVGTVTLIHFVSETTRERVAITTCVNVCQQALGHAAQCLPIILSKANEE